VTLFRRRQVLIPVVVLLGTAVLVYGSLYSIDLFTSGSGQGGYFAYTHDHITDAVGSLSGLFAAVLGILITVIAIIVQLSAERYTHVTQMFFRDRTNLGVLGFYVLACICGVFNSFAIHNNWVPRVALTAMIALAAVSFAMMAPYFAYVFDFLQPENIIGRIRAEALAATRKRDQAQALSSMEEMTDIVINSISGKDKMIAIAGVDGIKDFACAYMGEKRVAPESWFGVGPGIRKNPDFVSMAPVSIDDMERRHTWLEWKALRQYQAIYAEALKDMKDVTYVICIDTRYIGEAAIAAGDAQALAVCSKFFNTYLRATLNARDIRTAYNLLHQYRALAEAMLRAGWHDQASDVARYIKYYAHVGFALGLGFVTETAAYDLCTLCELAASVRSPAEEAMLNEFLEIDQPGAEGEDNAETHLRGVRKAQVKLATYYLVTRQEEQARRIYEDMKAERPERLRSIYEELKAVTTEDFWEVIDRGTNFDYLPDERKAAMRVFFGWFPKLSSAFTVPASEAASS
jgi:hypothetical protein